MELHETGPYVLWHDYAKLKAFSDEAQAHISKEERKSRERLDMEQSENARLKAEVERLQMEQKIKAIPVEAKLIDRLSELKAEIERLTNELENTDCMFAMASAFARDWNAAKEGKQP